MKKIDYARYEVDVSRKISESMADGIIGGLEPNVVVFVHLAVVGASLALIDPKLTKSECAKIAVEAVTRGFLDASALRVLP